MPTYEYKCTKCGHFFEVFQSIKDKPLRNCPECKSRVERVISSDAGVIFKGNGFYQTDYKNKNASGGKKTKTESRETCGDSESCSACPLNDK